MRTSVTDLWYSESNEKTFGPAGWSPHCGPRLDQFVPRVATLDARASAKLTQFVAPPAVVRGGYYAVVFVESKPELATRDDGAQPVYTNIRLGALILLTAEGTEKYDVHLRQSVLAPPTAAENLKLASGSRTTATRTSSRRPRSPSSAAKAAGREGRRAREAIPSRAVRHDDVDLERQAAAGDYEGVLTVVYGGTRVETRSLPFSVPD